MKNMSNKNKLENLSEEEKMAQLLAKSEKAKAFLAQLKAASKAGKEQEAEEELPIKSINKKDDFDKLIGCGG